MKKLALDCSNFACCIDACRMWRGDAPINAYTRDTTSGTCWILGGIGYGDAARR